MKSIEHLSSEEREHFIQCGCGDYVDMRNLAEVFKHLHADMPLPEWSYSVKKNTSTAYLKSGDRLNLN